jgi:hypothetical protein
MRQNLPPAGSIAYFWYGPIRHFFLVTDEYTVLHCSKRNGYVAEESVDILRHRTVYVVASLNWFALQQAKVRGRARIGERWGVNNNCEHFVSEICTGSRRSPQLTIGVLACLTFGFMAYAASR